MSVGMPAALLLEEFGYQVWCAFGETPYHVGSSVMKKVWRDVDVRLLLSDEEYKRQGFGDPAHPHSNAKWVSLVLAYSALGKAMTGLPIDFQIQQQSYANEHYPQKEGCMRSALSIQTRLRTQTQRGESTMETYK